MDAREAAVMPIVIVPQPHHHQMRTTSLRGDAPIIVIISCHHPPIHPPPLPGFCCRLRPLLIVKCPPLGSMLVSINSDAIGKDVGGGIILEIVINVALPI
jgi:hypothetical protein